MNDAPDFITPEPKSKSNKSVSTNIKIKLGFIALIVALLQIPLLMIKGVIDERQTFNVSYPEQYRGSGCGPQTITGPVLTIPYRIQTTEEEKTASADESEKNKKTKDKTVTKTDIGYLHFFPETLTVAGKLDPQVRDEGRFKSIVYAAGLDFKGSFNTSDLQEKKISEKDLLWQDASLTLGVSDLRGIRKETTLNWGNQKFRFVPGTNGLKLLNSGQSVSLKTMEKAGTYPFEFTVNLNGNRDLSIFPAGKENKIELSSSWKDPTFTGGFLPHQKTINQDGFNSIWEVSYFTRNLPQAWTDSDPEIKNSLAQYMVGVTLTTPVEFYRTAIRALKYGSLFIIMTFLTFFIFEKVSRIRIHEVQYLLVGLALSLFFLLLIAASEWIPFVWAYVLASIATVVQITWYTQAFSKGISKNLWKVLATTLTALYIYLYILLQLEDFSLLVGAIGLFIAMTIVLYSTRNINWYGEESNLK